MNRLPLEDRVRILAALVEGNSVRGTARMCGVDKKTVLRLLADIGDACDAYQSHTIKRLHSRQIQCDEIWSFCHAKERNLKPELRGEDGVGDIWTWTALDSETKLIITWHLGKRQQYDADLFIYDLSTRVVSDRVQISTDGYAAYNQPIQQYFRHRADHGSEVKDYGLLDDETPERKYSPMIVKRVVRTPIYGVPDEDKISTAHVERNNLTMRMGMRRFTRLTNAFSKKAENLNRALALHFMHYNFCRRHQSLKTTPAMAAGLTDRLWTLHDLAQLADLMDGGLAA